MARKEGNKILNPKSEILNKSQCPKLQIPNRFGTLEDWDLEFVYPAPFDSYSKIIEQYFAETLCGWTKGAGFRI